MPNTSPSGLTSPLCGGLNELFILPPHEAVRLEFTEKEPVSFISLLDILFILANLCMATEDGGAWDWGESFGKDEEE